MTAALAPRVADAVPGAHKVHVADELAAATFDQDPAGHCTHADARDAPAAVEYVPAAQLMHVLDVWPVSVL